VETTFGHLCAVMKTNLPDSERSKFWSGSRVIVEGWDAFVVSTSGPERMLAYYPLSTYQKNILAQGYEPLRKR
jgi:hypothetical protein